MPRRFQKHDTFFSLVSFDDSQDGKVDPADVHVDGVPTVEEERQMEEYRRYFPASSMFVRCVFR